MITRERVVLFAIAIIVAVVVAFFLLYDSTDAPEERPIGAPAAYISETFGTLATAALL
jgi:hypothetical protein